MPFLSPDHKPMINHPQGHPIAVIAAFNTLGEVIPRYFCIEDDNEELFKYQIQTVKSIKEKYILKIFYCTYVAYGIRNDIALNYDVHNHLWSVG